MSALTLRRCSSSQVSTPPGISSYATCLVLIASHYAHRAGLYIFASGPMLPSATSLSALVRGSSLNAATLTPAAAAAASSASGTSFHSFLIMLAAILFEAMVGVLQEAALQRQRRPLAELFVVTNGFGAAFLLLVSASQVPLRPQPFSLPRVCDRTARASLALLSAPTG